MSKREERDEELVEAYLSATGLTAIFIVCRDDGQAIRPVIGEARAVGKILGSLLGDKNECVAELWFSNALVGQRVFQQAMMGEWADARRQADGWLECSATEANVRLTDAIKEVGAKPLTGEDVSSQSREAVKGVIRQAEAMRMSGELKTINEAYKKYRSLFQPSESKPKPDDYQDWLHRVHMTCVVTAGAKIRQRLRFSTD